MRLERGCHKGDGVVARGDKLGISDCLLVSVARVAGFTPQAISPPRGRLEGSPSNRQSKRPLRR